MDIERMKKSPTGQLVRGNQGAAGEYVAFVPNPLPPRISLDTRLIGALSRADYSLGQLAGLGRNIPNPALLYRPFMRKEAVLSSKIEGTQADLRDVMVLEAEQLGLPGVGTRMRDTDAQEVLNYVHALEWGLANLPELPISLRLIREIHRRLLEGVRGQYAAPGEFRKSPNWIGPAGCVLNDATYVPPPPHEMMECLGQLEHYLHNGNSYPPLMRLGLIHYQFEAIHPFIDGNGRIGRLLLTLLLCHWGLLPEPLLYVSAYFERHRDAYYDRLLGVSERGAWEDWLVFFLTAVAEQSDDAVQKSRQLLDLKEEIRESIAHSTNSALVLRLVDELFSNPVITIGKAETALEVNYQAARRALFALVEQGTLVEAEWPKRPKVFFATQVLDVLG